MSSKYKAFKIFFLSTASCLAIAACATPQEYQICNDVSNSQAALCPENTSNVVVE